MRAPISTIVVVLFGFIVLLGYFIRLEALISLRSILVNWAVILAAFALLVGIGNLFMVHWGRMVKGQGKALYSGVLIFSLVLTLGLVGWFGPTHPYSLWIFQHIQIPIESSLVAILTVVLVLAGIRLLRKRSDSLSLLFIITAVVVLLTMTPLFGLDFPGLTEFHTWIIQVPALAGARGLLLGVALGIVATGLRVLLGFDRPYEG
jgi:hypothetical protein